VAKQLPKWASNPKIVMELHTQYLRVKAEVSAARLWERVLSEEDRQRLGGDLETCYRQLSTVGMWMKLRGVSQARAVADLAHELGFLDQTNYRWLLREIGEVPDAQPPSDLPSWEASSGKLRWKNQVIRKIRVLASPSNIQIILTTFEKAKWRSKIKNPLTQDQQQLHQALRSLNRGLTNIRFHAQEGGKAITWEIA
jgi:hypothetical protein